MSPDWASLFPIPLLTFAWAFALILAGGPLLLNFLNYQPVTPRALQKAAWEVVITGSGFTFGNVAISAGKRGLMSVSMTVLAVSALFATLVVGQHFLERWYCEKRP